MSKVRDPQRNSRSERGKNVVVPSTIGARLCWDTWEGGGGATAATAAAAEEEEEEAAD